jgi:hypothetical protein
MYLCSIDGLYHTAHNVTAAVFMDTISLLKPTGYVMYQEVYHFNKCMFCPHRIYVLCTYLRTNIYLCHLQHKLTGFYNRVEKCLLRGMNWGF